MNIDLSNIVQLTQIAFFVAGGTVAVLTFLKAKNGLLNTVNTEYHKRIIERLYMISEELYEEFDHFSPRFWARDKSTEELVLGINEQALEFKETLLAEGRDHAAIGIPITDSVMRLENLSNKYRTDPFLPNSVREKIVDLLQGRSTVLRDSHLEVANRYIDGLAQGKHWDNLRGNTGWIHNEINSRMYAAGYGVSQVEAKMHELRLEIQKYFLAFDPLPKNRR